MKPSIASALMLTAVLSSGCAFIRLTGQTDSAPNANVYCAANRLPANLRRVAVLPVTCDDNLQAEAGRDALQPVLLAELAKTAAFEVVPLGREQLRAITGQSEWAANEVLPGDLLSRLRAATGCDAVLFCHLRQFRAYPPLAVGWDLKLVDAGQRSVLWAVDEVFDAGDPAVARAAAQYFARAEQRSAIASDPDSILMSPRLFGQYAAASSFAALPAH
ncbi:MAG TPA: hypothetical protein VMV72_03265 [Verrucomicrobiae bacterium]|nr:hypothetical protein [Verrucomicrobiae bacterium]